MRTAPMGPYILNMMSNNRQRVIAPQSAGPTYVLHTIHDGGAKLTIAGKQRRLALPAAVLLQPGAQSSIEITPASAWIRISFVAVHQGLRTGKARSTRVPASDRPQPSPLDIWGVALPELVPQVLTASCHRAATECHALGWRSDLARLRANHILGLWLLDFVGFYASEQHADRKEHFADDWFERCCHAMRERLDSRVTITELANLAAMSQTTFRRAFRKRAGMSPREYLAELRIDRAKELLMSGGDPIASVARRCGVASRTTFSAAFRDRTGMSPRAWRQRHMG